MALRGFMQRPNLWWHRSPLRLAQLPLAVLATGVVTTGIAAEWVRRSGVDRHQGMEASLIEAVRLAVNNRLEVNIALLAAVKGLFEASPDVTRQGFARFVAVAASAGTLRGIQGVGFSRAIQPGQLASRERAIQAEGFAGYRVRPDGPRALYSAIEYLEPFDWRNQRAFGFDMYSEPVRRAAMERAMRSGLPSLSGKVQLRQETDHNPQAGSLLYLPIRKDGSLLGWAYSPLRLTDLIGTAIGSIQNVDLRGASVLVYDGNRRNPAQLLFERKGQGNLSHASYQTIDMAGRPWLVGVELRPGLVGPNGIGPEFWGTVAGGLVATGAVGLITRLLVRNQLAVQRALDLAERAAQERALAGTVFEASSQGIVVTDPNGMILKANHAYSLLSGYPTEQIEGQRTSLLKSGLHDQAFYAELWSTLLATGHWQGDLWNRVGSGELQRHHLTINAVRDSAGATEYYVGLLEDITNRYRAEEAVRHQALHDPLTGLGNRQLLMEQLQRDLAVAERHGQSLGLLYVDLDGFKAVNDCHGHAVGDRVLEQVAERFRAVIRQSDLLARLGGDEFVVLVPQARGTGELTTLAAKLVAAARLPFPELNLPIQISASVGIARYPDHGTSADALLLAADQAMYAAKEACRDDQIQESIRLASS